MSPHNTGSNRRFAMHSLGSRAGTAALVLVLTMPMGANVASRLSAGAALDTIDCPHLPSDLQRAPTCGGQPVTCMGTEAAELIVGTGEQDVIQAGPGNDVVIGNAGDDIICGGTGNDSLMGSAGRDQLYGEEGSDWLFGATSPDLLDGGPGDFDVLWGGPGFDKLDGGPGDFDVCILQKDMGEAHGVNCNTIHPPPGFQHDQKTEPGTLASVDGPLGTYRPAATTIICPWLPAGLAKLPECGDRAVTCMGTDGNDLIYGSDKDDVIWAGPGNDVVHADAGDDWVCGGPGIDALMGAGGDDFLHGGDDDDWLFGALGDDRLYGGRGEMDVLWSGPGEDRLDGGAGASDVCLLQGCMKAMPSSEHAASDSCETVHPEKRRHAAR